MPLTLNIHQSQALCRGKLVHGVRLDCGYDFTLEFNSKPPHESPYNYKCPKCGNTGQYKRVK